MSNPDPTNPLCSIHQGQIQHLEQESKTVALLTERHAVMLENLGNQLETTRSELSQKIDDLATSVKGQLEKVAGDVTEIGKAVKDVAGSVEKVSRDSDSRLKAIEHKELARSRRYVLIRKIAIGFAVAAGGALATKMVGFLLTLHTGG